MPTLDSSQTPLPSRIARRNEARSGGHLRKHGGLRACDIERGNHQGLNHALVDIVVQTTEWDLLADEVFERSRVHQRTPELLPAATRPKEPHRADAQVFPKVETAPQLQEPRDVHVWAVCMGGKPCRVDRAYRGAGENRKRRALAPLVRKDLDDASDDTGLVGPSRTAAGKHDARLVWTRSHSSYVPNPTACSA